MSTTLSEMFGPLIPTKHAGGPGEFHCLQNFPMVICTELIAHDSSAV